MGSGLRTSDDYRMRGKIFICDTVSLRLEALRLIGYHLRFEVLRFLRFGLLRATLWKVGAVSICDTLWLSSGFSQGVCLAFRD